LTFLGNVGDFCAGAVRDALEVVCATGLLVEGDAGLMRGLEFDLLANRGGEGCARSETQDYSKEEGNTKRDATGYMMFGGIHHRVTFHWKTVHH
jgi:hypothetical protein